MWFDRALELEDKYDDMGALLPLVSSSIDTDVESHNAPVPLRTFKW